LKVHKEVNGDCNLPQGCAENPQLRERVSRQRKRKKKEKVWLLKGIGFHWVPQERGFMASSGEVSASFTARSSSHLGVTKLLQADTGCEELRKSAHPQPAEANVLHQVENQEMNDCCIKALHCNKPSMSG
jgi:hypothetical protein